MKKVIAVLSAVCLSMVILVSPASAGICTLFYACPPSHPGYVNNYLYNDNSAGQQTGVGIQVAPYTSGYQIIVPPGKFYANNGWLGNYLRKVYIGSGYCARWIKYETVLDTYPFQPSNEVAHGYVKGPVYISTPALYNDWAVTTYTC
jgi:hypothetical protein